MLIDDRNISKEKPFDWLDDRIHAIEFGTSPQLLCEEQKAVPEGAGRKSFAKLY